LYPFSLCTGLLKYYYRQFTKKLERFDTNLFLEIIKKPRFHSQKAGFWVEGFCLLSFFNFQRWFMFTEAG